MGCGAIKPEPAVNLVHLDGAEKLEVFADGKFVVPPGKNAVVHVIKKYSIDEYPSFNVVDGEEFASSDSKGSFTVKPAASKERSILCDGAGTPVFAVTRKCEKLSDAPSVYAVDEAGEVKDELFRVSMTKKHKSRNFDGLTTRLLTRGGKEIELNGTLDVFGCFTGRNGSNGGHICKGDMGTGTPIAKLTNANERPDLDLQRPTGKKTPDDYLLEVAPGVDMALMLAMLMAWNVLEDCDRCESVRLAAGG